MRRVWVPLLLLVLAGCVAKSVGPSQGAGAGAVEFPEAEWAPVAVSLLESTENGAAFRHGPRFVDGRPSSRPVPPAASPAASAPSPQPPAEVRSAPPVPAPPLAAPQRATEEVAVGESVQFSANSSGSRPLTYQWRKDGRPLPGQTNALLTLAKVGPDEAGVYDCMVSNAAGSKLSDPVKLVVGKP